MPGRKWGVFCGLLVATGCPAQAAEPVAPAANAGDAGAALEILFHADLDGRLAALDCGAGAPSAAPDYAALVGTLNVARQAAVGAGRPAPLVLLGGNIATPDLFGARLLESPPGVAMLAAILGGGRYDAVTLGQHELALPPEALNRLLAALEQQGLPVVLTNLTCDGRVRPCPALRATRLIGTGDASVGVVATIAPSVATGIPAAAWRGLALDDPLSSARAAIGRLRGQGARWVVLLAQGPRDGRALDDADALARRFAELPAANRPDVILAGGLADDDGERALRLMRRDGAPPVVGTSLGTASLARVRLPAPDAETKVIAGSEVTAQALPIGEAVVDAATAALLAPPARATCQIYGRPVSPAPVRGSLTREAFTTYVLEVMRRRAGAEIALVNRAFVKRAPFPITGAFSRLALQRALPYQAVVGVARLSGAQVEAVLGPALALDRPDGRLDLAAVGLRRVGGAISVNGRPLDKARGYRVATIAFVAGGGDGLVPPGALAWRALPGAPELRQLVQDFLGHETGRRDGDPSIDVGSDFGPPAATRPLVVAMTDVGLDLAATSIANAPGYGDAQLVRAQQLAINVDAAGLLQLRHPRHEADGRLALKYGWSRTQPPGGAAVAGETTDLITFTSVYNYRGLRGVRLLPSPAVPDPYARVWVESEIDRPAVTTTQPRAFHHLQLTNTVGALFTVTPRLRLRGGAGVQRELLASGVDGRWRPLLEAGGTLDPVAMASVGPLVVKVEGLIDYNFVDPARLREHQLRGNGKLSVPLLPALFITAGINVFAVQRERRGWGASYDTTLGLRVHLDAAHQRL